MMFKRARTAAKAHEIVEQHFGYELKGFRKSVFKRTVNTCYKQGMNEFAIAFSFMLVMIETLTDDYSSEKEQWVNRICDKMSGLIFDMDGWPEQIDPFDILTEQRNRFKSKNKIPRKKAAKKSRPKKKAPKKKAAKKPPSKNKIPRKKSSSNASLSTEELFEELNNNSLY